MDLKGLDLSQLKALADLAAAELKAREAASTLEGILAIPLMDEPEDTVGDMVAYIARKIALVESLIPANAELDRKAMEIRIKRRTTVAEPRRSWQSLLIKLRERGVKTVSMPGKEKDARIVVTLDTGDAAKPFVWDGKHWSGSELGKHLTDWPSINVWAHAQVTYKPVGAKATITETLAEAYSRLVGDA